MRVLGLYVHPVKGCRAVAADAAALGPLGLEHDRRFAFVAADASALTQRDQPLLATIRPAVGNGVIRLDFGGLFELALPLGEFVEHTRVDVWGAQVPALAAPERLVARGADYLGAHVRLAMLDPGARRAFVDSRPVLVTSTGGLERLGLPEIGMERFRPNIVLEGALEWNALEGEEVRLEREKPCGRCEVTTIDQASGARRGPEPLRTLNERFDGKFGFYCRVARPGRLRRGDILKVA
jgi:uncharacterized protein